MFEVVMRKPKQNTRETKRRRSHSTVTGRRGAPSSTSRQPAKRQRTNRRKKGAAQPKLQIPRATFSVRRVATGVAVAVGSLVGGAAIAYGAHSAYLHATTAETFAIELVSFVGADRASVDELEALADVAAGDNLLQLDSDTVQARVERHPWVRNADVRKKWPRGVQIDVGEHDPVALVALGHLYYADSAGRIVKRLAPSEQAALPVVTGLSREAVEQGAGRATLVQALTFLDDVAAELGESAPAIEEIHWDEVMGLSFTPVGAATRVHVGQPPWRSRIGRWSRVVEILDRRNVVAKEIATQHVRHPNRVVARLQSSAKK